MSDDPKKDDEKRDEVLKRMLGTKPEPKGDSASLTKNRPGRQTNRADRG